MMTTDLITFDELTNKIKTETSDNKFRVYGELLLSAINDWPTTNLQEPKDLIEELRSEMRKPLTFDNLTKYSNGLKIGVSGNAWRMESVAYLLEMFDSTGDKAVTLDKIIENLTNHFRTVK